MPGQVYYDATRKLILRGVDGIVFVADSQTSRYDANIESLYNLHENLEEYKLKLEDIPFVAPVQQARPARRHLGRGSRAGAQPGELPRASRRSRCKGDGVFDTLKCVAKGVLKKLSQN